MKAIYIYKENDIINPFIERQIRSANFESVIFSSMTIEKNDTLETPYLIYNHHTLIIENEKEEELARINGPFDSKDIESIIFLAKITEDEYL